MRAFRLVCPGTVVTASGWLRSPLGLAVAPRGAGTCYVDDATNMLRLLS